ncbi:MAG: hypothetical protein ACOX87_10675, partial [Chloroflexota bacterium]
EPGGRYCRYHRRSKETLEEDKGTQGSVDMVTQRRPAYTSEVACEMAPEREQLFYSKALDEGAWDLEVAAAMRGVSDEIALLRMLIRKAIREGDAEATRKGIETLCRALKLQYALEGRSAEGLASSLARVLDEVGNELGITL